MHSPQHPHSHPSQTPYNPLNTCTFLIILFFRTIECHQFPSGQSSFFNPDAKLIGSFFCSASICCCSQCCEIPLVFVSFAGPLLKLIWSCWFLLFFACSSTHWLGISFLQKFMHNAYYLSI